MTLALALLPLAIVLCLYAGLTRLAARLVGGATLKWRHAWVYALLAVAIGLGTGAVIRASGLVLTLLPGLVLGGTVQWLIGTRYLGPRIQRPGGGAIGYGGAALVTALVLGALVVVGFAVAGLVGVLQRLN